MVSLLDFVMWRLYDLILTRWALFSIFCTISVSYRWLLVAFCTVWSVASIATSSAKVAIFTSPVLSRSYVYKIGIILALAYYSVVSQHSSLWNLHIPFLVSLWRFVQSDRISGAERTFLVICGAVCNSNTNARLCRRPKQHLLGRF